MVLRQATSVFEDELQWRELTVPELFARQAELSKDAPAIVFGEVVVTYQQLEAHSNQLAHYLQHHGVGPETVVALYLERGVDALDHLVALLAVWKAGGAYLTLDRTYYPEVHERDILADGHVQLILTRDRLRPQLPQGSVPIICLDTSENAIRNCPTTIPISSATLDSLAYLIYTSGSTGQPKGVLVEHRWLPSLAHEQIPLFGVQPGDRLSHLLAPSFDASLSEYLVTLLSGATLYPAPKDALLPGQRMVDFLEQHQITLAHFTPSVLGVPAMYAAELPALHTLVVGGKACPLPLARHHTRKGRMVIPVYGLTESVVCNFGERWVDDGSDPCIGRPFSYVRAQVWNAQHHLVADGEEGQIVLAGPLARGYTSKELTAERFLEQDGQRWLLTGDKGTRQPDGRYRCDGRLDRAVKLPGEVQLNLDSVEAELCALPAIADARVFLLAGRHVIAYVTPAVPGALQMSDVRVAIARRLPPYAQPAVCVALAALPLGANGKPSANYQDYPPPTVEDRVAYDGAFRAPNTPTELELAELVIYFGTMEVEVAGVVIPVAGGLPFPTDPSRVNVLKTVRELGLDSSRAGGFELGTRKAGRPLLKEEQYPWPLYKLAWYLDGGFPPMPEYLEGA